MDKWIFFFLSLHFLTGVPQIDTKMYLNKILVTNNVRHIVIWIFPNLQSLISPT